MPLSSVVTVYFSEPKPLEVMKDFFSKGIKGSLHELKPLEVMRKVYRDEKMEFEGLVIVRNVSKLLQGKYSSTEIIPLLRKALRILGSGPLLLIEVSKLSWSPSNLTKIRIDGIDFPVSSIRVDETYSIAEELDLDRRRFVIADI